jgi:uncharacterized membrane protein YvlD (DUF360 family)
MRSAKHVGIYHPDIAIFLVAIPLISAFNYYLTYTNIQPGWFLVITFLLDTIQGYAAWWGVRSFILYLDRVWPYGKNPYKRILVQLFATTLIGLIIISVLTEIVSWIAKGRSAPLNFYTFDLFIIGIWFFVINGVYVGIYYFNIWKQTEETRHIELQERSGAIMVKLGKQDIKVPFQEITGFYVEGEYVVVTNIQGKKYYLDQSLDKTEKELPASLFFRLNRQIMLHRQTISGFKRIENGKLQILLSTSTGFPSDILVSRTKASSFKEWFQQG